MLYLKNTIEIQNFGWNISTFIFLVIIFFALFGVWGLINQTKKIWNNKSGKATSVTWYAVFMFMFASFLVYGIEQNKLGLIFMGVVRVLFYIPVLVGLWKFKKFKHIETFVIICLFAMLSYMIFSDNKAIMFLVFSYLGVGATALQPLEIWQERSAGVVSIKLLLIYSVSGLFWIAYGFILFDLPVLLMSVSLVIIYIITIALYFKFPEDKIKKTA